MITTAQAIRALSTLTTRDKAGAHYTQRYSREVLDDLISRGWATEHRPSHRGVVYSEERWHISVTDGGLAALDLFPDYHDAATWPECWIVTDREQSGALYAAAEGAETALRMAENEGLDRSALVAIRCSVALANHVTFEGGETDRWHVQTTDDIGDVATFWSRYDIEISNHLGGAMPRCYIAKLDEER